MKYNAARHTLEFDDGSYAAKLCRNISAQKAFEIADSLTPSDEGDLANYYREQIFDLNHQMLQLIEKADKTGKKLRKSKKKNRKLKKLLFSLSEKS